MAVGISRSIGIGMKKCCGGGAISPPPPSPFPLRFINTLNVPAPSGCDVFDASITITRNGTTFLASEMSKTSNNTSTTTVNPISVYATDIIEVRMDAFAITDPTCSGSVNETTVEMSVGSAINLPLVSTVTSNDSPPYKLYQFSPVQGSLDIVSIKGSSNYVAPPPSTFTVTLGSSQPTNTPSCTTFDLTVNVYDSQGGNLVATETATKISNNNPYISNPQITVSPGYYIECIVTSQAPGNVTCQQTWTGTDVFLETGPAGGTLTSRLIVHSEPNPPGPDYATAKYSFFPVQGTEDEINIYSVG
jgi:hypothetical protein